MKYSIFINPQRLDHNFEHYAIGLIKAIIHKKHEIISIFFYGNAVKCAFESESPWQELAIHHTHLVACSTLAQSYQKQNLKLSDNFQLQGLGQWMEAVLDADKKLELT